MSVNPLPPGTPGPATIARIGFELAGAINRAIGGGISPADKERLEAGRRQGGYVRTRSGWIAPDGGRVTERTVIEAGRTILAQNPPAPGSPGYRPDLTETIADKKPPKVVKPPKVPKIPGRAGRIVEGAIAVGAGSGLFEIIRGGIERISERPLPAPAPKQPPPPPVNAAPPGASFPEIGYRPPFVAPPAPKQPPPPPVAQIPRTPVPAPAPPAPIDTERLGPLDVYTPYASIPAAPAPTGTVTPAPRTVLGMSPAQLAGLAVPTLLALLAGTSSGGRRRRDPLTQPQPLAPGGPTLGLPFVPGLPGSGLTPGAFPLPWPGGGGLSFGGGGSQTDRCECPPKRKRKKQAREVCYSGTFIERASGLSKTRKRKVLCR